MIRKTNLALACAALALGTLSLRGQTATTPAAAPVPVLEPVPAASWTITASYASQYMFRGVRLGGPSFEPRIEFAPDKWKIGVWANFPISAKVVGQSDPEIDPYATYTFTVNDSTTIVPGFTWYNYPNAKPSNGFYKTTFEPNVALNYTVKGITFSPTLYYDMVLKGPTLELNVSFAVPLKGPVSELDFNGTLATYKWDEAADNTTPSVENSGNYWLVGVTALIPVSKDGKFAVGLAYTEGSDNYYKQAGSPKIVNTAAVGRGVLTVNYVVTF
jgi:uncharacterized protein (TIGR02001 family)